MNLLWPIFFGILLGSIGMATLWILVNFLPEK